MRDGRSSDATPAPPAKVYFIVDVCRHNLLVPTVYVTRGPWLSDDPWTVIVRGPDAPPALEIEVEKRLTAGNPVRPYAQPADDSLDDYAAVQLGGYRRHADYARDARSFGLMWKPPHEAVLNQAVLGRPYGFVDVATFTAAATAAEVAQQLVAVLAEAGHLDVRKRKTPVRRPRR